MAHFSGFNISLLLILSFFCSEIAGQNQRDSPPHLRHDGGGSGFTEFHIALAGSRSCDSTVIAFLDQQLALTHSLAQAASTALLVPGIEKSVSYHRWFGYTNEHMKEIIKRNNYDAVVDYLLSPSSIIDWYSTRLDSNHGSFTNSPIDPKSLVYVCGRSSELPCDNGGFFAATSNQTPSRPLGFERTVFTLCPSIFNLSSFEQMKATWISSAGKDYLDNAASTLLHEAQHMSYITGLSNRRIDVDSGGLKYPERACHNPQMCSELFEDSEKLQNADNYVFFAMDALFRPDTVAPPALAGHQPAAELPDQLVISSPLLLENGLSSFITSRPRLASATTSQSPSSDNKSSTRQYDYTSIPTTKTATTSTSYARGLPYFDTGLYSLVKRQVSGLLAYATVTKTSKITVTSSSTTFQISTSTQTMTISTLTTPPQTIPTPTYSFDLCIFNKTEKAPPGDVWPYGLYVHPTSDESRTQWFEYVPWVICNDSAYYTVYLNHSNNTIETLNLGGPTSGSVAEADSANTTSPVTNYWWKATKITD